jgi:maltooligosyltrehalose trehalohydrolase
MQIGLWAPTAQSVVVHVAARAGAESFDFAARMDQGRAGWWTGPEVAPGVDYAFSVDGAGPFPDPRSPAQPSGVHGPSRAFDANVFAWSDTAGSGAAGSGKAWQGRDARGAVFYEIHVGTFTPEGTLDAAAARLPGLAAIGIEMVELMPIAPFPGRRGWGYDGVSIFAVHEAYGGPEGLQRFVDAAHAAGLGVCLDVVYNHMGPDGNYLAQFGPYFTSAYETPWGWAVNLDQDGSGEVRRYLADNALRWLEDFHLDALRLDAVHQVHDHSPHHFLAQLSDEVAELALRLNRPLSLIAESDLNDEQMVAPTREGGRGMAAQWDDDVHHALHAYLTGERQGYYVDFGSAECLDKAYRDVFWHDGTFSLFRGRDWGRPVALDRDRRDFVVCASDHDQVGNRALGDRPSATLSPGAQAASLAFVLLSPFTPMIFMGEEYGEKRPWMYFTDFEDPTLAEAVRKGRTEEFSGHGWQQVYGGPVAVPNPQDPATARASVLDPESATGFPHDELRAWFAELIAARRLTAPRGAWAKHPVGVEEPAPRVLVLRGPVTVHANLSDAPVEVPGVTPLATFGEVTTDSSRTILAPDSLILVDASTSEAPEGER